MTARLAIHLPPHQLPELQRAARALLRRPTDPINHSLSGLDPVDLLNDIRFFE